MKKLLILSALMLSLASLTPTVNALAPQATTVQVAAQPTVQKSWTERLKDSWNSFWGKFSSKSKEVGHEAKDKAAHAWDSTKAGAEKIGDKIEEEAGKAWDKTKEAGHSLKEKAKGLFDAKETASTDVNKPAATVTVKTV